MEFQSPSFNIKGHNLLKICSKVNLSATFYPQMDGQAECTIQMFENMLRHCVIDFKGTFDDQIPLIEFAYSKSYHSSIKMTPYDAL